MWAKKQQQQQRAKNKRNRRKVKYNKSETEERWITYEPTCRTKTENVTPFVCPYIEVNKEPNKMIVTRDTNIICNKIFERTDFSNHEMRMNLIWSDVCDKSNHFNRTNPLFNVTSLVMTVCTVHRTLCVCQKLVEYKTEIKCSLFFPNELITFSMAWYVDSVPLQTVFDSSVLFFTWNWTIYDSFFFLLGTNIRIFKCIHFHHWTNGDG